MHIEHYPFFVVHKNKVLFLCLHIYSSCVSLLIFLLMNAIRIIIVNFGDNHGRERQYCSLLVFFCVNYEFFSCLIQASRLCKNFLSSHVRMEFDFFYYQNANRKNEANSRGYHWFLAILKIPTILLTFCKIMT